MPLKIYYFDHPILRKRAEEITEITDAIRELVNEMIETMDKANGVGLAAPQVGHSLRLFVLRNYIEDEEGNMTLSDPRVYINPKLSDPSDDYILDVEGCLSIPGIRMQVARPDRIRIEATDLEGNTFVEELEGYNARVRMHENDHLNGVLFIDRLDPRTRKQIEPDLRELKKKYKSS